MIVDLRNKKPYLHFGFNVESIDSFTGATVTVYQDVLYNTSYSYEWNYTGGTLISENANQIVLLIDDIELLTIGYTITNTFGQSLVSEDVVVDSKPITWGTQEIFFNNTEITFDTL